MDHMAPRGQDPALDLETGVTISEEEGLKDSVSGGIAQAKKLLSRVWSGLIRFDGSIQGEDAGNSCNLSHSTVVLVENAELSTEKLEGEEKVSLVEKNTVKDKPKKKICKKPPKPPRPPRGPSLDAADQKLIREISELAMLKRARIERMKALKKMKAAKAASSSSNTCAMVVTIIFCLVILFQGIFSRGSSNVSFSGSPESAVEMKGGLISVHYYNVSSSHANSTSSESLNIVEQVTGLGTQEVSRAQR